jgi:HlyD family secretion protein
MHFRYAALALLLAAVACGGDGEDVIEAVGTIEVTEFDVAPSVPARVVAVRVEEGQPVRAGDTLVLLSQATLPADLDQRRARAAAAVATLRDLEAGARPAELERAEAELRAAEAEAERTARDAERLGTLHDAGSISTQQYDAARAAATTAASRRDAAREALRLLRQGARPDRVSAARAEVASARASVAAAEATAADLVLVAPVSGSILMRHVEPGEVVAAGTPAVTVGEMARPWARVYVSEHALPHVRLGGTAVARLDGLDREFQGRVVAIADRAEFTPRVALTEEERADLVFGVKVELRDTTGLLKPGLPATIRLESAAVATGEKERAP